MSKARRGQPSIAERDRAVQLVREGTPLADVADGMGRHPATVHRWCTLAGWPSTWSPAPMVATTKSAAAEMPDGGVVYFLSADSVDRVKVGFTRDRRTIVKRMASLAYSSPVPVTLMKCIAGSMQGERWLHAKWAEHRHHGEWFTLSAIRADIEAMESVRDVSAEVEAAKACADCGVYRKGAKRGQVRCRACANKRNAEERARLRATVVERIIDRSCPCGARLGKSNTSGLCRGCGMRKAWGTDEYRKAIMPSRNATQKRCPECGEQGVGRRAKYHPECWTNRQAAHRVVTM